jgi:hypothetical protein
MSDQPNGEYKFENCKHRSAEQTTVNIKRCSCQGGDYTDTGYECLARKIFKVEPNVCEYCYMFEQK